MFVTTHTPPRPAPEIELRLSQDEAARLAGLLHHQEVGHESLAQALESEGVIPRPLKHRSGFYLVTDTATDFYRGMTA